ncbi:Os09g0392400, partial [Oryza sativa Japonica Group]
YDSLGLPFLPSTAQTLDRRRRRHAGPASTVWGSVRPPPGCLGDRSPRRRRQLFFAGCVPWRLSGLFFSRDREEKLPLDLLLDRKNSRERESLAG